jgi:hypothetical protein
MRDAYEVLYQKEADLVRVRQEVESLRITASLLGDDDNASGVAEPQPKRPSEPAFEPHAEEAATGTDTLFPNPRQPRFWEFLKPARR